MQTDALLLDLRRNSFQMDSQECDKTGGSSMSGNLVLPVDCQWFEPEDAGVRPVHHERVDNESAFGQQNQENNEKFLFEQPALISSVKWY